jgi:hypothetical protein
VVTECFKSFVWKVLGGDRTVMLRFYRSLVDCSRLWQFRVWLHHEVQIVYHDRIPSIGICLATGAFRSSRLESLCTETGEPPLDIQRSLVLCGYVGKLAPITPHMVQFSTSHSTQVRIKHSSLPTYGCVLPQAPAMT